MLIVPDIHIDGRKAVVVRSFVTDIGIRLTEDNRGEMAVFMAIDDRAS